MGAITDLLESLLVTPVTPGKNRCNRLQTTPSVAVTRVTPVTPENIKYKTKSPRRPVLTFTIDGTPNRITAIDTEASSLDEALARLRYSQGHHLSRVWSANGRLIWERDQFTTQEKTS